MNRVKIGMVLIAAGVAVFLLTLFTGNKNLSVLGGTPGNIPSQVASSTKIVLAAKQTLRAFSTSTALTRNACASRTISAYGGPVTVVFDDPRITEFRGNIGSTTLSYMVGHQLASSTLHVLDSANYGCGDMYIHAPDASTTVTVTEFR